MSTRADHSEYQPLRSTEDESDTEQQNSVDQPGTSRRTRRPGLRPGSIDLTKLDNAFKRLVCKHRPFGGYLTSGRWTESIAQKVKRKKKTAETHSRKHIWRSVFEPAATGLPGSGFVRCLVWLVEILLNVGYSRRERWTTNYR